MKAQKEKLRVIIWTSHHRIRGEVHLYENSRLTDILNADNAAKDFLPVTDAVIYDLRDKLTSEVSFISINRKHIEVVMEDDEAIALGKARDMLNRRNYKEALQYAQRAVKACPQDAEARYLLGLCLAKNNDTKGARLEFDKTLKLNPTTDIALKTQEMLHSLPA